MSKSAKVVLGRVLAIGHVRYSPVSDRTADIQKPTLRAMYGRRPRCKMNLAFCEAFGCSHVSGSCFRVEACPVAMQPLWPLALM